MPDFTVFHVLTGRYVMDMTVPDAAQAALNAGVGEAVVEGHFGDQHYLRDGDVRILPPRPAGDYWQFDLTAEAWIDPRGPEELAAAREAARNAARMETAVFLTLIALPPFEIITPEESMAASRSGEIPATFQAILDMMDPADRLLAVNKWARDEYVSRSNPLLNFVAVGQYGPVDADAILDQIFGIEVPA